MLSMFTDNAITHTTSVLLSKGAESLTHRSAYGHKRDVSTSSVASNNTISSFTTTSTDSDVENEQDITDEKLVREPDGDLNPADDAPPASRGSYLYSLADLAATTISHYLYPKRQVLSNRPRKVTWTKPGRVHLHDIVAELNTGNVAAFQMLPGSYLPHSQLAQTFSCLKETVPMIRELVMISQIYTLEELNLITSSLKYFPDLRSLSILDVMDEPPEDNTRIMSVLAEWKATCPSLETVQLSKSTVWEKNYEKEDGGWTERSI